MLRKGHVTSRWIILGSVMLGHDSLRATVSLVKLKYRLIGF